MTTFIPNLIWSCRVMHITDATLWSKLDQIIYRMHRDFSLEELQSIIPTYFDLKRVSQEQDKLLDALENRFNEVRKKKRDRVENVDNEEQEKEDEAYNLRVNLISDYLQKIKKLKGQREDVNKEEVKKGKEVSIESDDEEEEGKQMKNE